MFLAYFQIIFGRQLKNFHWSMDMKQEPRQLNVVFLFETKLNSIHVFKDYQSITDFFLLTRCASLCWASSKIISLSLVDS